MRCSTDTNIFWRTGEARKVDWHLLLLGRHRWSACIEPQFFACLAWTRAESFFNRYYFKAKKWIEVWWTDQYLLMICFFTASFSRKTRHLQLQSVIRQGLEQIRQSTENMTWWQQVSLHASMSFVCKCLLKIQDSGCMILHLLKDLRFIYLSIIW